MENGETTPIKSQYDQPMLAYHNSPSIVIGRICAIQEGRGNSIEPPSNTHLRDNVQHVLFSQVLRMAG